MVLGYVNFMWPDPHNMMTFLLPGKTVHSLALAMSQMNISCTFTDWLDLWVFRNSRLFIGLEIFPPK